MNLLDAETILRADPRIKPIPLHDELYELSFETRCGRQIALNRMSSKTAVRLWIEKSIDPEQIGLSSDAKIKDYPVERPRAHLSASRLTGPYQNRRGNSAWYVSLTSRRDLMRLLDAYLTR